MKSDGRNVTDASVSVRYTRLEFGAKGDGTSEKCGTSDVSGTVGTLWVVGVARDARVKSRRLRLSLFYRERALCP